MSPGGRIGLRQVQARGLIIRLLEPKGGTVTYRGRYITHLSSQEMLPLRKKDADDFQDPYASLNPRQQVATSPWNPCVSRVAASRKEARERAQEF